MVKVPLFLESTVFSISSVTCFLGPLLGPGRWLVLDSMQCENLEQYEIGASLSRQKLNKTHDCFNFTLQSGGELNSTYGGPGRWMVINILQCEDADQYEMVFTVSRRKMNRTHDCFCLTSDLHREINITYGTIIDVYKKVDGGFKLYHHYSDDCLCELFKKYAEENMQRALTLGGFDPPDCPLKPRSFEIKDFVMDYTELPENGLYGKFKTYVYLVYQGEKIGCIQVLFNFEEGPYEDDDD